MAARAHSRGRLDRARQRSRCATSSASTRRWPMPSCSTSIAPGSIWCAGSPRGFALHDADTLSDERDWRRDQRPPADDACSAGSRSGAARAMCSSPTAVLRRAIERDFEPICSTICSARGAFAGKTSATVVPGHDPGQRGRPGGGPADDRDRGRARLADAVPDPVLVQHGARASRSLEEALTMNPQLPLHGLQLLGRDLSRRPERAAGRGRLRRMRRARDDDGRQDDPRRRRQRPRDPGHRIRQLRQPHAQARDDRQFRSLDLVRGQHRRPRPARRRRGRPARRRRQRPSARASSSPAACRSRSRRPALNAKDGQIAVEELQLAYEKLQLVRPTPRAAA